MIVIRKREAARAAYWAVVAYFALSTLGPLAADFFPGGIPPGDRSPKALAAVLLSDPAFQVYASLAIGGVGYIWPGRDGYPTSDNLIRALLLALVVGVVFIGLANHLEIGLSFWTGCKAGFVVAALFKPPSERRQMSE